MRRKSSTSAWVRSLSSTRKTPEPSGSAKNLPNEVAEAAPEAAQSADAPEAAQSAEAPEAAAEAAEAAAADKPAAEAAEAVAVEAAAPAAEVAAVV